MFLPCLTLSPTAVGPLISPPRSLSKVINIHCWQIQRESFGPHPMTYLWYWHWGLFSCFWNMSLAFASPFSVFSWVIWLHQWIQIPLNTFTLTPTHSSSHMKPARLPIFPSQERHHPDSTLLLGVFKDSSSLSPLIWLALVLTTSAF